VAADNVSDALARCERPDELIQIAWDAGLDRRQVIRAGADAASTLFADERTQNLTLFWPVPRPLEGVDRWLGVVRPIKAGTYRQRPFASAVWPGAVLGYLTDHFVTASRLSGETRWIAMGLISVGWVVVVGAVLKVLIEASLRRQASRLDEDKALARVLEQLRIGMTRHPLRASDAAKRARNQLVKPVEPRGPGA
jgi:hypothetical protein